MLVVVVMLLTEEVVLLETVGVVDEEGIPEPVVEVMFIDFTTCAMDMIVNQMAKIHYMFGGRGKVPMVLRTNIGAGRGAAAQHAQSFHAFFMHIPGLIVVAPSCPYDAKGLMNTAIRDDNPVVFIEHKKLYAVKGEVPEEPYTLPFGKAEIKRAGLQLPYFPLCAFDGREPARGQ